MSNYPAGVTGHEPQIAGYDDPTESTEDRTCEDDDHNWTGEVAVFTTITDRYGHDVNGFREWACPMGHEHSEDFSDNDWTD